MESFLFLTQFLSLLLFPLHFPFASSSSLNSSFPSSLEILCPHDQSHALLLFKSSFSINASASFNYSEVGYAPPYPKTESWKEGTDCCSWNGVTCDLQTGNLIVLDLSSSMLYGSFPSHNNSLFLLSHLQKLDLSNNDFIGSNISSQFGQLLHLTHLNLNSSNFEGHVPSEISHLSNLVSLDLSWDYGLKLDSSSFSNIVQNLTKLRELTLNGINMSMVTPSSFMNFSSLSSLNLRSCELSRKFLEHVNLLSGLVSLDLSWNYDLISDTAGFVKLVQNLTNLKAFDLSFVNLSSVAPTSFMNLSSSLTTLQLSSCDLQGEFPNNIPLPELVSLDLSGNDLISDTAGFVKLVQNLTKLKEFDLSGVNLSSVAPTSFMNFSSSLTSLKLQSCQLQGKFPNIIHLPELVSLDLSGNDNLAIEKMAFHNLREVDLSLVDLSSVESNSLMNLSSSLSSLNLNYCQLQGEFPGNFLQRPNLRFLSLTGNDNLTGLLPRSNWSGSLQQLSLSRTKISINLEPDFIINLRSLKELFLVGCSFIGSNLAIFSNLTQLNVLSLSYNNFSGEIPSSFENLQQLTSLDLSSNSLRGEIPSSFGNLQYLILLDLSSNSLSGEIPSSFTNLKQLAFLDLRNNSLNGPLLNFLNFTQLRDLELSNNRYTDCIPSQICSLSTLISLDLSNNLFNETIPFSLFTLPQLEYLNLKNNQLNGPISQFRSESLHYIDLSNNNLHSSIPSSIFNLMGLEVLILSSNHKLNGGLSSSICKLKYLQILDLSNNSLTGFVPQCLGNFSDSLSVLHLGFNNFSGIMPKIFSKGTNLRYLNFKGNQLQGRIPQSMVNCKNLEILDLSNNEIDDVFPIFLGGLPNLQILVLQSNKLYGSLTLSIGNSSFPMLRIFDLSNNTFSGPLPEKCFNGFQAMMNFTQDFKYMGVQRASYDYSVSLRFKGLEIKLVKIQTTLSTIDLSLNKFKGEIPISIGRLKSLILFNLSHNCLTGNIQPSLGNLTSLESLDLSSNLLTGKIPMQLVDLTSLEIFRVSYNQLEGHIPNGKQFNTFGIDSYEGNLGLCGFPLSKECEDNNSQDVEQPEIEERDDSGYVNGFGWNAALTGYGCGLVLGFSLGYIVFTTRKPKWFVKKVEGAWNKKSRKKLKVEDGRRN